jgi:hypothetical protein
MLPAASQAQRRTRERIRDNRPRDLRITVRDTLGNRLDRLPVFAFSKGRNETIVATTDRSGNRSLRVRANDTLQVYVHDHVFLIETDGLDSIGVTILNPPFDPYNYLDPVAVVATRMQTLRRKPIDTGLGMIAPENFTGASTLLDGSRAGQYFNLLEFLKGKVPGLRVEVDYTDPANGRVFVTRGTASLLGSSPSPVFIVDGNYYGSSWVEAYPAIPRGDIESVFVIREGFGIRGAGGAIIITTKYGARVAAAGRGVTSER